MLQRAGQVIRVALLRLGAEFDIGIEDGFDLEGFGVIGSEGAESIGEVDSIRQTPLALVDVSGIVESVQIELREVVLQPVPLYVLFLLHRFLLHFEDMHLLVEVDYFVGVDFAETVGLFGE